MSLSAIPRLLWINFKVRVSTGMSPGLISAQGKDRQAGSLLYPVTHFRGGGRAGGLAHGAGLHTPVHIDSPGQNDPGLDVAPDGITKRPEASLPRYL